MRSTTISLCIGTAICSASALADGPALTVLDFDEAADVTVDESGHTQVLLLDGGMVWVRNLTLGGTTFVGTGVASHLSADGTTIPGSAINASDVQEAGRWTTSGSFEWLGALPDALPCPSISSGYDTSGDGSVVVGLSWDGCSARCVRWTAVEGMTELEPLGDFDPPPIPGFGGNRASVISDDGQVIAGFAQGTFNRTPAVWNASDNSGWLLDIDAEGEFSAINADGSILAGQYLDATLEGGNFYPFTWTEEGGVRTYPYLPDYPGGIVLGVADDGKTLVGISGTIIDGRVAMVWRPEWGTVDLMAKLIELGAAVPELFFPQVARGVTDDGRTVVGWGVLLPSEPGGPVQTRGFVATLPPQAVCPGDLDGDWQVGFTDLTQLLGAWGPCS